MQPCRRQRAATNVVKTMSSLRPAGRPDPQDRAFSLSDPSLERERRLAPAVRRRIGHFHHPDRFAVAVEWDVDAVILLRHGAEFFFENIENCPLIGNERAVFADDVDGTRIEDAARGICRPARLRGDRIERDRNREDIEDRS